MLVCALPWHPLSWWARLRLAQQSELACDDWAIAGGQEPVAYAETLLELVSRRRVTTALAAVSRRSGLAGRITHILDADRAVEPRLGRSWSGVVLLSAIGLVVMIALAQARAGHAGSDEMKKPGDQGQRPAKQASRLAPSAHREVRGSVRDASGGPIPVPRSCR